jgi:hypothetical protein
MATWVGIFSIFSGGCFSSGFILTLQKELHSCITPIPCVPFPEGRGIKIREAKPPFRLTLRP